MGLFEAILLLVKSPQLTVILPVVVVTEKLDKIAPAGVAVGVGVDD